MSKKGFEERKDHSHRALEVIDVEMDRLYGLETLVMQYIFDYRPNKPVDHDICLSYDVLKAFALQLGWEWPERKDPVDHAKWVHVDD